MTRRRALALASIALGSTGLLVWQRTTIRRMAPTALSQAFPADTLDDHAPVGHLSDNQRSTLVALAAIVLPGADDGHRAFATAYFDARAQSMPGAVTEFRVAAALLDAAGEGLFGERSATVQRRTVERLLPSYSAHDAVGRWRARVFRAEAQRRLHILVVRELVAAFYASPEGWRRAGHPRGYGEPAASPVAYTQSDQGTR